VGLCGLLGKTVNFIPPLRMKPVFFDAFVETLYAVLPAG